MTNPKPEIIASIIQRKYLVVTTPKKGIDFETIISHYNEKVPEESEIIRTLKIEGDENEAVANHFLICKFLMK